MPLLTFRTALPCMLALLMAGCSNPQEHGQMSPGQEQPRVFSEAEKSAARALSIGNGGGVQEASSRYEQALACSRAIESLALRFRQSGVLTEQQMQAVDQAKALYDRQAGTLGNQEGKSAEDIRANLRQTTEDGSEARDQALQAMGCLQNLDQAG